jgi:hypothetical protein
VSNLTFVVPVDVANASGGPPRGPRRDWDDDDYDRERERERDGDGDEEYPGDGRESRSRYASSAQVAELADELIVYQSETRHLLTAVLAVMGLTALIVVVVSVLRFLR